MATSKYLDQGGVERLWSRIKSYISSQVSSLNAKINGKANSSHTHTYGQITNLSTWKSNKFGSGSYSNSGTLSIASKATISIGNESLLSNYNSFNWLEISSNNGIRLNDSFAWWGQSTKINNSWLEGALISTEKVTITELNVSSSPNAFEGVVPEDERIHTTTKLSGKQYIKTYMAGDMFTTLVGSNRSESITTKVNFTGSNATALYLICYLFSNSNSNGKVTGLTTEFYVVQNGNSVNLSFSKGQTRLITGIIGYKV